MPSQGTGRSLGRGEACICEDPAPGKARVWAGQGGPTGPRDRAVAWAERHQAGLGTGSKGHQKRHWASWTHSEFLRLKKTF